MSIITAAKRWSKKFWQVLFLLMRYENIIYIMGWVFWFKGIFHKHTGQIEQVETYIFLVAAIAFFATSKIERVSRTNKEKIEQLEDKLAALTSTVVLTAWANKVNKVKEDNT